MRLPKTAAQLLTKARSWADERFAGDAERPVLTPGVELIGEYDGSGLKDPPYITKLPDGQVVQVPRLLFLIAAAANGERTAPEIAELVTAEIRRRVRGDDVH